MTYTPFTQAELEAALPPRWQRADDVRANEIVYRWVGKDPAFRWQVLCYSGVHRATGVSRDAGADAIRFVLLDAVSGKGVGKVKRIHRTGDVASLTERMAERIRSLGDLAKAEEPLRCRRCGAATIERTRKADGKPFRGCLQWQECREGARPAPPAAASDPDGVDDDVPPEEHPLDEEPDRPETPARLGPGVTVVDQPVAALVPTAAFPLLKFPYEMFNPMQSLVLPYVDTDCNIVVAAPTSSGKTVVAEMLAAWALNREGPQRKALFLSPLKAVTREKYDEWGTRFRGYNLSIVTGDYQLTKKRQAELAAADIILLTSEMLDSRTRRMRQEGNAWLLDAAVLVCDEAHLLTVADRGPALECGLVRFTEQNDRARIVLLSATMPNVQELGVWLTTLNGKPTVVVQSEWRPVPHTTHYLPHPTRRLRYRQIEAEKIAMMVDLVAYQYPQDRFLVFVHSKATGRAALAALRQQGVPAEFHSADLDKETRLRLETEFKRK